MAYAAVISLKQTIHRLLNSTRIWIGYSSRPILQSAYEEATSLQKVLEKFDDGRFRSSRRLDALDGEIRDAVRELEDALDHSADLFLSQSQDAGFPRIFFLDREGDLISSFTDAAKKMKEDYIEELDNALLKQEDEDGDVSIDFGVEMVGLSNEFSLLKKHVLKYSRPYDFVVFSITGRAGTGRTVVAKALFEKLRSKNYFECGAWVSVGRKYELKDIFASILAQIYDDPTSEQQNIGEYLHGCLKGWRYMIVLDDVWDTQLWDLLRSWFPEQHNGNMVLLTTSLKEVALSANSSYIHRMHTYNDEQSWHIIVDSLDDGEIIMTPEMEEAGRKIAKNCQGLHMAVTKVGILLAEAEKTLEYWKKLAADEHNSVFLVSDEISENREIGENLQMIYPFLLLDTPSEWFPYDADLKVMEREIFPISILPGLQIIAVFGMAGIGKTTVVKKIFEDPSISCHFNHRVWLTLGPKCESKEILADILAQIYPDEERSHIKGDLELSESLCGRLSSKRCLIVLDDIWTSEPLHYLQTVLPKVHGKVILTTRFKKIEREIFQQVSLLSKKESWQLFCKKVFGDGSCPPILQKIGQRISDNCEGLPLLILTVADILSRAEMTPEFWDKAAEDQSSVFLEANHKLSRVLLPSYQSLQQHLKGCFLYMGVFPQKYEISTKKLINYWIVEGLHEQNVQSFGAKCSFEISDRSLSMFLQNPIFTMNVSVLHCVFWYLSNSEAAKTKFFHAMSKCADCVVEDTKGQRRLCIRNNVLFAIKDVHTSLASFSAARSLLCTGPSHPYPVPIYFGLALLRVLSAHTIRFYEFPSEVVKLIHLRYLSLICSTKLHASVSKLQNLQFLIVDRHLRIKSSDVSYMPKEIWDMKELNHLQIKGSDLPDPKHGIFLLNLSTLLDVSADSCTKKVLEGIPHLKRLRIHIEIGPNGKSKSFHCLNNISKLGTLNALCCVVIDPTFGPEAVIPPAPVSMFPSSLKILTLSGLGYPWEYMSILGKLENLQSLTLQSYAFRGPVWETKEREFLKLKYLVIDDADLVCWRKRRGSLVALIRLSIQHCYKLQELPCYFKSALETIEVVDSNPLVETWAEGIKEGGANASNFSLHVHSLSDAANQDNDGSKD